MAYFQHRAPEKINIKILHNFKYRRKSLFRYKLVIFICKICYLFMFYNNAKNCIKIVLCFLNLMRVRPFWLFSNKQLLYWPKPFIWKTPKQLLIIIYLTSKHYFYITQNTQVYLFHHYSCLFLDLLPQLQKYKSCGTLAECKAANPEDL